jgi:hypothetical protein
MPLQSQSAQDAGNSANGAPQNALPQLLVNHLGFRPSAAKTLLVRSVPGAKRFSVIGMRHPKGAKPALIGELTESWPDLGHYQVGNFSALQESGVYRISVHADYPYWDENGFDVWSHDVVIGNAVYEELIQKLINYYRVQSCGASAQGYNRPCHTGNIPRDDGRPAGPLPGGWHAACDCHRDLDETLFGLVGLVRLAALRPDLDLDDSIYLEIRWGNDYFLSMQDREGFLYYGVAVRGYNDDSKNSWDCADFLLTTRPVAAYLHHLFVAAQADIARLYAKREADYAARCLLAGTRCQAWIANQGRQEEYRDWSGIDFGAGGIAAAALLRATGESKYQDYGGEMANRLVAMQAPAGDWTDAQIALDRNGRKSPGKAVVCVYSPLAVMGLCAAAEQFEKAPERARWIESLNRFAAFAGRFGNANAFGILPARVVPGYRATGFRPTTTGSYRYFIEPDFRFEPKEPCWQTGNNAVSAGYGVALIHLSRLLGQPDLRALAQRQLDWILGVNPHDASMVLALGRNNPSRYASRELDPPLPYIAGAAMEGFIGDAADNPLMLPGFYANVEYWMPHQAWVLWLAAGVTSEEK